MNGISIYKVNKSVLRILHTGDTHLGSRQYQSEVRRQDFFDSFARVIQDAIDDGMDAVVHTGDLFDNRNPTIEDLIETIAVLTPLKKAGIPFLGIVGNHESKQNTQWLDIFEEMGLAERLGTRPVIIENETAQIRFYGIDNLSGPRLASYDFSIFDGTFDSVFDGDSGDNSHMIDSENKTVFNILALHQLLEPVLPGQPLSCDDFTSSIPITFDAVLLGDNHKYECIKHNGAWLTYPGSTERCSAAEVEPRSYNILTFEGSGSGGNGESGNNGGNEISITRRNIPTRDFITIPIASGEKGEFSVEEIYSIIDAYSEKIKESVVFVEFSGVKKTLIPISEIEEYVKKKGAVVARVGDKRDLEKDDGDIINKIVFRDPDEVVTQELRKLNLTEAGYLLDGIIRDMDTAKTNIAEVSETRLKEYLETHDFKEEFKRESIYSDSIPISELLSSEMFSSESPNGFSDTNSDSGGESDSITEPDSSVVSYSVAELDSAAESDSVADSESVPKLNSDDAVHKSDTRESEENKKTVKPRQYTLGDMFGAEDLE